MNKFEHKLMDENLTREQVNKVIEFLRQDPIPILTNASPKIKEVEDTWSSWLGCRHSLLVSSGTAANYLTILGLKRLFPNGGEILVPTITWVSDVSSVLLNGFTPVFIDTNLNNLGMDINHVKSKINKNTIAIFLTHALGFNCLNDEILNICQENNILLIEDCCEGYPVYFQGQKTGTFGFASNFSFFAAHHATFGFEAGMVCTNDDEFYQYLRANRSHSMCREMTSETLKNQIIAQNPLLNKDFIFLNPSGNFRSNAISAVFGLEQIKTLDEHGKIRANNFNYFLSKLDKDKYRVEFDLEGQNNYALILILRDGNINNRNLVENTLDLNNIGYRRGCSGGGLQTLQPYLLPYIQKGLVKFNNSEFPNSFYITQYSWYLGNTPRLTFEKIDKIVEILNNINFE